MRFSPIGFLSDNRRGVELKEVNNSPGTVLTLARSIPLPVDQVWETLTKKGKIPHWFLPINGDLKVGGRYQFVGNAGGRIMSCVPKKSFRITWEFANTTTWVEVRLADDGDHTDITLEHSAWLDKDQWDEYGPGAVGIGWEMALMGLTSYLLTGVRVAKEEAVEWMDSDEGHEFIRLSSEGWAQASIVAGTPEDAAKAAGESVTAMYCGDFEMEDED